MLISIMFSGILPSWSTRQERTGYESSPSMQRSIPYFTMACNQEYPTHYLLSEWIQRVTLDRAKHLCNSDS